jgi:hypothetical protein
VKALNSNLTIAKKKERKDNSHKMGDNHTKYFSDSTIKANNFKVKKGLR